MIHSYGFLETGMTSARDIFLDLPIPNDDPLMAAKRAIFSCAPGVRISDRADSIRWDSEFIWIVCVNEEDGLLFQVARAVDGSEELQVTWKGQGLSDASELENLLKTDRLWDVFHLRAVALIQERVERQLNLLYEAQESTTNEETLPSNIRDGPRAMATELRDLETTLLVKTYEHLESQVRLQSERTLTETLDRGCC